MRFNVSTRIFGGFALVVLFAMGIFVVSLVSIGSISKGVSKVTDESVPMLITSSDLSNSLLKSEIELSNYFVQTQFDLVKKAEELFLVEKNKNDVAIKTLANTTQSYPDIFKLYESANTNNDAFYQAAEQVIGAHKIELSTLDEVNDIAMDLGDLGDEMLSYS
ncbi:CHASE3 domain-containing protein, partial [Paraglaciecola sp.]|uniref:CHASE3 domain-containing protein n=1 Tax=Paraglaciecola sp. TaxID=1920173 RepID=UPI003EF6B55F